MAIGTENAFSGPYTANGVTTAFPFDFTVLADTQVAVMLIDADGAETTADPADYSVSLNGAAPTDGTVTFTVAPATGYQVVPLLDMPFTQETQFVDGSAWKAAPANNVNDRAALRDQVLKLGVDRSLKVPFGETTPAIASLADAEGMVLGVVNGVITPVENTVVNATSQAAAAAVSAAASAASSLASALSAAEAEAERIEAADQANLASLSAAAAAAYTNGYLFDTAAEGVSQGVVSLTIAAAGSGGANGQFALAFSGGGGTLAAGTFTVSGGAVIGVNLTKRGKSYTSDPTISLAASAGLGGGASVTAARGNYAVPDGEYYLVKGSGSTYATLYKNVAGVATSQSLLFPSLAAILAANSAVRSLAEDGVYTEAFLDNTAPTKINLTDGAAITATITNNVADLEIDQATGARTVLYSTLNTATVEQRLTLRCEVTAAASAGNGVGIAFYSSAGDYSAFYYQANGWFRQHTQAGLTSLSTALDAWSGATIIDYVVDIFSDGTARLSVTLDSGKTWHFGGLTSVPLSSIKLVMADTMTCKFSMTQAAVPSYVSTELANLIAAPAPSPYEGLMNALEITPVAGLSDTLTDAVKVYRFDSTRAFTNLSLASELATYDPQVSVVYVDVATGSDSNPGTATAPLQKLCTAIARCIGGKAKIIAMGGEYVRGDGFNQAGIANIDHLEVVSWDGEKVISSCHETLTWALDTGTTYSATYSDFFYSAFDAATVDANGDYLRLADAGTLVACRATSGSYYKTGSTIYVNLGRAVDTDVRIYTGPGASGTGNFYYLKTGGTVYLEDVELHGGFWGAYILAQTAGDIITFKHRRCKFNYCLSVGLFNQGKILSIGQESAANYNTEDGFSYHYYSAPLGVPYGIEVDCTARSNGWNATGTNNGSTTHDGGQMIRVNCTYSDNQHRQIHDVNGSLTWMVGCTVTAPRAGYYSNYAAGVGGTLSLMYLDGCTSSGTKDLETIVSGSTIYTSNFTTNGTNVSGATVVSYTP